MSNPAPVTHSVDPEGIAWIVFDDPVARANTFTPAVFAALHASLAAVSVIVHSEKPAVRAIVITSAKEKIFLAGADLKWLATLPDATAAELAAREGQAAFEEITRCGVPVVCAIHGACAGGGYELALACTWRIASDAPETKIGLPEVRLGLIPGWGGCTRLSRLIGTKPAVEFILKASLVHSSMALTAGLIDGVVPLAELKIRAKAMAMRLAAEGAPIRENPVDAATGFFAGQRAAAASRWRGQPAALAVIEAVEKGASLPLAEALPLEAKLFGSVAAGAMAKNLIRIFRLKEKARKTSLDAWFPGDPAGTPPASFRTIGIVGAGVMGSGIAHWCAMHGFGVIMCDSSRPAIERGVAVIRELFADGVRRGKVTHEDAHRMTGGIGITTSLEDFEFCDLVIEAIVEDATAKRAVFKELSALTDPDCVLASASSVCPIEELTAEVAHPERVVGLHFCNLVSRMPLVEIALSPQTSRGTAERALKLMRDLEKTPVITRSAPGGFLTRVLTFYLNEACALWEQGATVQMIDEAMRQWGWPMGPMRLIDEIGIDTTDALFAGMAQYFPDRFTRTKLCEQLMAASLLGRKNGVSSGFYEYGPEGEKPNPAMAIFRPEAGEKTPGFAEIIQHRLNGVAADEAKRVLQEGVVKTASDAELALLLGAGFPVFQPGLVDASPGAVGS